MNLHQELKTLDPKVPNIVSPQLETPTPHRIAVLLLVQQYLKAKQSAADVGVAYPSRSRARFCMLLLKLLQYPDLSYKDLHNLLTSEQYKLDTGHMHGFERGIADLCSLGIESLFDFAELQNIEKMLSESVGVSQYSIVGLFIRRMGVMMENMSFSEMMDLYKSLCLYYENGVRKLAKGGAYGAMNEDECLMDITEPTAAAAAANSSLPAVIVLSADLFDPDQYPDIDNLTVPMDEDEEMLSVEPEDTITIIDDRLYEKEPHSKWSIKQANLFVAQQANLLENNEMMALSPIEMDQKLSEIIRDNPLHSQAYFLVFMNYMRLRDFCASKEALLRAFDRSPAQMMNHIEQKGFQFSSLNMGVMHASFGHRELALKAFKECIMLAQQNCDRRCLELANSWKCVLNSHKMNPFERSMLETHHLSSMQTLTLGIQFIVKFGAHCGYRPVDLFELLAKTEDVNSKLQNQEHLADSLSLRAALWALYGRYEQTSLVSQLLLKMRRARIFGDMGNTESVCKVMCNVALWLSVQGELAMANVVLNHARSRFPRHPLSSNWIICHCHMKVQTAIHRAQWHTALQSCCRLYVLDKHAAVLLRASIAVARRYLDQARSLIAELLQHTELEMLMRVRALTLLAYTMITDDTHTAEAVDVLLRASILAYDNYLAYELAITDMLFAHILLKQGIHKKALQAIKNGMEEIQGNGGIYDRARANFVFVKCLVATGKDNKEKRKLLLDTIEMLKQARTYFEQLESYVKVLDIYVYLAKTFREIGDEENALSYARRFRDYYAEHETPLEYMGHLY